MARKALLVGTSLVASLFAGAVAQARPVPPARVSPGPAPASLSNLVAATGGNAGSATAARYDYLRKLDSHLQVLATDRLLGNSVIAGANQQGVAASSQGALVDVYVNGDVDAAAAALRGVGMRVQALSRHAPEVMVEGWLPASALTDAAGLGEVRALAAIPTANTNAGAALSQGDAAHNGPAARALGTTGAGVKVGVISDSINQVGGGVAGSQGTGDLPPAPGVHVLLDGTGGADEGRAMGEIIYDEAPGISDMYFTTGGLGAATRATGIANLVANGVKVIADDTFQINEPFFQDGVVAQAVDAAKAAGTAYLVSAGNRARQSWEGTYAPTADPRAVSPSSNDFNPGAGQDAIQTLGTFTGVNMFVALQWDEPFGHVSTNLALDVYTISGGVPTFIGSADTDNIATGLPVERVSITVPVTSTIGIAIRRVAGTRNPFMKYIVGGTQPFSIAEYPTNSGAIDPDASSARGALTVAASRFGTPATPEAFSSRGPTRKLFDAAGNRLATPEVRFKPNLDAADSVATTVTGFGNFRGTSAAAPSAAGIAALVRSARPSLSVAQLYAIMTSPANAIDCTTAPGQPDFDCGSGFILADRAVRQARDVTPPVIVPLLSPAAPTGANGFYTGNVALAWSVIDTGSPISATVGCGPVAITTDGVRNLTCTAVSVGGTATRTVTLKRDASPPTKPKITGIKSKKKYTTKKLPKKSKIKCKSTDPTSGIVSCKITGFSKKLGKHTLKAKATDGAGLTSTRTLKYTVKRTPRKH